jgi:hypothetical protein
MMEKRFPRTRNNDPLSPYVIVEGEIMREKCYECGTIQKMLARVNVDENGAEIRTRNIIAVCPNEKCFRHHGKIKNWVGVEAEEHVKVKEPEVIVPPEAKERMEYNARFGRKNTKECREERPKQIVAAY